MGESERWHDLRARWRHWRHWQISSMPLELRQQRELERARRRAERVHWRVSPVAGGHDNQNYPPKDQPPATCLGVVDHEVLAAGATGGRTADTFAWATAAVATSAATVMPTATAVRNGRRRSRGGLLRSRASPVFDGTENFMNALLVTGTAGPYGPVAVSEQSAAERDLGNRGSNGGR